MTMERTGVRRSPRAVGWCLAVAALCSVRAANAQVPFEVLHYFPIATSPYPNALVQAADGSFYGTTFSGGAFGVGTAFKMTPSGTVTILHDFADNPDGASPYGPLVQATDGNFYGITYLGGSGEQGTVYKMTPTGAVTVLHSFLCAVDGCYPEAGLIQAADGNLYGTASYGGPVQSVDGFNPGSWGNLFRITPKGTFAVLHWFSSLDPAGYGPAATLLQVADGSFYGTTAFGGGRDSGAVFKMASDGTVSVVHIFIEGLFSSAFVQGADGNFYGALNTGCCLPGSDGAVFKMTPTGLLTVLHYFTATNGDGAYPSGLLRAADGNFYGTTSSGGDGDEFSGHGTVFRMTPDGTVSTLYTFTDGADGAYPGPLIQGSDGNLYGADPVWYGTVFRVTTAGVLATLANGFPGFEGFTPQAALIEGTDGNLYGTTAQGGRNYIGAVFRVTLSGATTVVHSFTGTDGASPRAALLQAPDGNFYGTASAGGASNLGTVFRMAPDSTVTVLHAFTGGTDGASPYAALVGGLDGNFYGTTRDGGALNFGTVFRVTPAGAYTVLYQFAGGYDGGHPLAALVLATDGNFYGTTSITGAFNAGTAFRITSQGTLTILHAFSGTDGTGRDGSYPQAALLQARDGNFYGTTYAGGMFGDGTLFRMTVDGAVRVLHAFRGTIYGRTGPSGDGANPVAPLIQGADGNLYGTASSLGAGYCLPAGTAFQSTLTGSVTVLFSFSGDDDEEIHCGGGGGGTHPVAALLQARDGNLYGTASDYQVDTEQGLAEAGGGSVFRLLTGPGIPVNLHAPAVAGRHPHLSWSAAANATSYVVKRGTRHGGEVVVATGLTALTYTDLAVTVTPGTAYYYVVEAVGVMATSDDSSEVAVHVTVPTSDFDGDGKSDIAIYRPGTGRWYVLLSSTNSATYVSYQWGVSTDTPVAGDYDGDGKTDIAVYRPGTGLWYVLLSSTNFATYVSYQWGVSGDIPVPGDYDGDGKGDIAAYRPSSGDWYILWSSTGYTTYGAYQFGGLADDVPVPGDYDGDGKTDIAVYRPSNGDWYILSSSTSYTAYGTYQFGGLTGDVPVPGDYDGDGQTDIAVYRPSSGDWYILWSRTSDTTYGTYSFGGVAGDVPVPGDYDGDGKTDIAVYRPSTGDWYILWSLTSDTTYGTYPFGGLVDDIPLLKRP
jgi:uncharacterized repeat protein (TIGR03803 family)